MRGWRPLEHPIPFNGTGIPRHAYPRLQFRRPLPEWKAYDLFLSIRPLHVYAVTDNA